MRQGTDPDGLAAELATPEQRRRYIATFYTSRFWAHPGAFAGAGEVDFHTEPFADAREAAGQLRWLRERVLRGRAERADAARRRTSTRAPCCCTAPATT